MTQVHTVDPAGANAPLLFTDTAAKKVFNLLQEEEDRSQKLRVFVSGGGCSGFQYGFKFVSDEEDGDTVIEKCGVQLLVDVMSVQYLTGAEIDYVESAEGAQFVIRNPNASTSCGCGNSFSV